MSDLQNSWHGHNYGILATAAFLANTFPVMWVAQGSFGPEQVLIVNDHLAPVINALLTFIQFSPGSIFGRFGNLQFSLGITMPGQCSQVGLILCFVFKDLAVCV
jgi:hypothetical protein